VPLAQRQALGIAIMSYNGRLGFGLLADFDALPDLDDIAGHLASAIEDLAAAAGLEDDRADGARPRARRAPTPAAI
jgi:diacylglycerol O-acyltransferase